MLFFISPSNPADALCMYDSDWPDAPCYGCPACYPGIEQEKKDWEGYYLHKGAQWMEEQKKSMMNLVDQGKLRLWLDPKSEFFTDSNQNVWNYYYLQGIVPRENGKYLGEFDPPIYQYSKKYPQSYVGVLCNEGLELIVKKNLEPACVYPSSVKVLIERNWANPIKTKIIENTEYEIVYDIQGATLSKINLQKIPTEIKNQETLALELHIVAEKNGTIAIKIPHDVMNTDPDVWNNFLVLVDGIEKEDTQLKNLRGVYQMYLVPFESGNKKITISLPQKPLWITIKNVEYDAQMNGSIIEISEDDLFEFQSLYYKMRDVNEVGKILYTSTSIKEAQNLSRWLEFSDSKQAYLKYDNRIFKVNFSFQYGHPSDT